MKKKTARKDTTVSDAKKVLAKVDELSYRFVRDEADAAMLRLQIRMVELLERESGKA